MSASMTVTPMSYAVQLPLRLRSTAEPLHCCALKQQRIDKRQISCGERQTRLDGGMSGSREIDSLGRSKGVDSKALLALGRSRGVANGLARMTERAAMDSQALLDRFMMVMRSGCPCNRLVSQGAFRRPEAKPRCHPDRSFLQCRLGAKAGHLRRTWETDCSFATWYLYICWNPADDTPTFAGA
jgi:hypothetical protein